MRCEDCANWEPKKSVSEAPFYFKFDMSFGWYIYNTLDGSIVVRTLNGDEARSGYQRLNSC